MTTTPAHQAGPRHTARPSRRVPAAGALVLAGLFFVAVPAPLVGVVVSIVRGVATDGPEDALLNAADLRTLLRTCLFAAAIALVALLAALPAAFAAARARPAWLLALAAPMLLPSYLAFAAWSTLRAPTTPLGRWIASAPERGDEWLPMAASRVLAVWGLALWAWPLAAVVVALGLRAVASQLDDALRMDCPGPLPRWRTRLKAALPSVLGAWVIVALLMLGSAVPLHVARVETYAIRVWTTLDQHPGQTWRAWLTAWPLVAVAALAAWWLARTLAGRGYALASLATDPPERSRRGGLRAFLAAALPWSLSVLIPLDLLWWSMGTPRALALFLERAGPGVATSLAVGAVVGGLAVLVCLATAHACAHARSTPPAVRWVFAASIAWALVPGVLAGAAVAELFRLLPVPRAVTDTAAPMVLAHLSRFLFLPILVGIWLAASEPGAVSESRRLDGATGFLPWFRTAGLGVAGPALAVGAACLCLSVHEIESSLQVQTPGIQHLAQRLLQWLHYERTAELSAAGVLLLTLGIAGAASAALLTLASSLRPSR